jgi:hypothetical protein
MGGIRRSVGIGVCVLVVAGSASASPAPRSGPVSVNVPPPATVYSDVKIGFRPVGLPRGGYYYAILVLDRYPRGSRDSPVPPCAISSDMSVVDYGYPDRGRIRLTLKPAKSAEGHWCSGGTYIGGVYAVSHRPPCNSAYPCYGRSAQGGPGCGATYCGVPAFPVPYSYPGGLPESTDRTTRIIGHFKVHV